MSDLLVSQSLVVALQAPGALGIQELGLDVNVRLQVGPEDALGLVGEKGVVQRGAGNCGSSTAGLGRGRTRQAGGVEGQLQQIRSE